MQSGKTNRVILAHIGTRVRGSGFKSRVGGCEVNLGEAALRILALPIVLELRLKPRLFRTRPVVHESL